MPTTTKEGDGSAENVVDPAASVMSLDSPSPTDVGMRDPENDETSRKERIAPGGTELARFADPDGEDDVDKGKVYQGGMGESSSDGRADSLDGNQTVGGGGGSAGGATCSGGRHDHVPEAVGCGSAEMRAKGDVLAEAQGSSAQGEGAEQPLVDDRLEMGVSALLLMFNSASSSAEKTRKSCR